ncbi:MAG: Biotin carrier protein MADF [Smithella sp. PtaU1.Bin162]|jgi:acetyl-CoA carboxylase biotin carboxyl carrier protein|nr:MAG: Biotin carrier protein MADF [Smithella sp. PtaU1.Bin162]
MSTEVKSPIPGKIVEILVNVGDQVAEDEEIIVMEAMKMKNPVYSTAAGSVQEIKVKEGEEVNEDQVLVVLG